MQTSEKGIALIKEFEGCRLTAYQDSVGIWTIGYGWTNPVDGYPIRNPQRPNSIECAAGIHHYPMSEVMLHPNNRA